MGEQKLVERPLMQEGEFKDFIQDKIQNLQNGNVLNLKTFEAVSKFKSVRRAIRRGHISPYGEIYPKRPFNNAKHKKGSLNDEKKRIYEQLKHMQGRS